MAKTIEGLVGDADGTYLDTREWLFGSFEHALRIHGIEIADRTAIARQIGHTLKDCYAALAPDIPYEVIKKTHVEYEDTAFSLITAYSGLITTLRALAAGGLKLGVYSSRYGNLVPSLDLVGATQLFQAIVDGKQVTHPKPHPEGFQLAFQRLGIAAEHAAVVGDAVVDIAAGKAAGAGLTIAVTHGFGTREDLEQAAPDYIIDSLDQLPALLLER